MMQRTYVKVKPVLTLAYSTRKKSGKFVTMAALSPKSDVLSQYCVRLISLPTRLHPSILGIKQVLTKFQLSGAQSSSKAESICTSLSSLQQLQKSVKELLDLEPLTRKNLPSLRLDDLLELLEESVMYIDVCNNVRDAIMLIKQGVREVQYALRRRRTAGGDLSTDVKAYICIRKSVEKELSKSLTILKHAHDNGKNIRVFPEPVFDEHCLSSSTTKSIREANVMTASVLLLLVSYLLVPVALRMKSRARWSLVLNLHKGLGEREGQKDYVNELEGLEVDWSRFLRLQHGTITLDRFDSEERIQCLQRKLEAVESTFEDLEYGMGGLFRSLINTRVSLLNIVSDHRAISIKYPVSRYSVTNYL